MNELALFAGIGGGILGTQLLGHRCVCAVENDPHAQAVLVARQNDKMLPVFPIWDDVTTFDGRPWRGIVDIISGGFPCQDISSAGKQKGLAGERSGLWKHMSRIIGEVQPKTVFIENSPQLTRLGLSEVLSDLAKMGYDAEWGCIGANNAGAKHRRERLWVVANNGVYPDNRILQRPNFQKESERESKKCRKNTSEQSFDSCSYGREWWRKDPGEGTKPELDRMVYGYPNRVDRAKRLGNAQVPAVARLAFEILNSRLTNGVADTCSRLINSDSRSKRS